MPPAAAPAPAAAAYSHPATRFTIPGGAAALGAEADDVFSVRRDGPFANSAKFADIARPAAGDATIPRYQVQSAVVLAIRCDLEDASVVRLLKGANALQHELTPADCSAVVHEAANRKLLESPLKDWRTLASRILGEPTFTLAERTIDDLRLEGGFTAGHPCPPELEFLYLTTWYDLYTAGRRCDAERPACLLAYLFLLLGSRGRRNTREDQGTTLRTAAP